ncbi:hypothetical protein [Roseibium sediminis]|uniref:hypothetical protein n=1 Tax=Roseibium sediminis TaxID=1775174 RepID=UPI00123CA645|nr:hypothetical protein [Roseibium sediminis]
MPTPAKYNWKIWVGNTTPLDLRFLDANREPFDLTGSDMILTIFQDGELIRKSSADGHWTIDDPANGRARVVLNPEETRKLLSEVSPTTYEIERHIAGEQTTLMHGRICVKGGQNHD